MFKWSKHRPINDPVRTPFLKSVALPEVPPPGMQVWTTQGMGQSATRSAFQQRSITPSIRPHHDYSESTRPRTSSMRMPADQPIKGILKKSKADEMEEKEKLATEKLSTRPRSSSNAQAPVKGILKAPKVYPIHPDDFPKPKEKPVIPPTPEPKGRPDNVHETKLLTKKSSKTGGGYSHLSGAENHLENSNSHDDYPERYGRAPSHFYQGTIAAPQPMRLVDPPRVPEGYNPASNGTHHNGHAPHHYNSTAHQRPTMHHQAASYPMARSTSRSQQAPHLHLPPTHGHSQSMHYPASYQQAPPPMAHPGSQAPIARDERTHLRRHSSRERSNSIREREHSRQRSDTDIYRSVAPGADGRVPDFPKVAPKAPQISLSWPLVSFQLRQQKRQATPKIHFDLSLGPQASLSAYVHGTPYPQPLRESDYMQSASSHCDIEEMKMICAGLEKWPFTVRRSGRLSCYDVFEQIHQNLIKPLTSEELASFSPVELQVMRHYFEARVENTRAIPYVTRKKGLCRVDALQSKKMFREIVRDQTTGLWVILTEDPPMRH